MTIAELIEALTEIRDEIGVTFPGLEDSRYLTVTWGPNQGKVFVCPRENHRNQHRDGPRRGDPVSRHRDGPRWGEAE